MGPLKAMTTDDGLMHGLPHLQLTWNTPLSEDHADRLLSLLDLAGAHRLVDLGCGRGELLLRALARSPRLSGEGIEECCADIERARSNAAARGLADRVKFICGDLLAHPGSADRAICIGADHAWGSVETALSGLGARVTADGLLLFGCGYWLRPPSRELVSIFGALPPSFHALLSWARSTGWMVLSADSANLEEWDAFEAKWNQDLDDLAAGDPAPEVRQQALRLLKQRRDQYENGYRGVLGFAYLILSRGGNPARTDP